MGKKTTSSGSISIRAMPHSLQKAEAANSFMTDVEQQWKRFHAWLQLTKVAKDAA